MISEFIPFSVRAESELVWCLSIPLDIELPCGYCLRDIINKSQKAIISRHQKIKESIKKVHEDYQRDHKFDNLGHFVFEKVSHFFD